MPKTPAWAKLTDPYGHLNWCIGTPDDFVCLDYAITKGGVVLHSVVNSETGHFIMNHQAPALYPFDQALAQGQALVDSAWDWIGEQGFTKKEWRTLTGRRSAKAFMRELAQALSERKAK